MAKKKRKKTKMTFRERFRMNEQKALSRRQKYELKRNRERFSFPVIMAGMGIFSTVILVIKNGMTPWIFISGLLAAAGIAIFLWMLFYRPRPGVKKRIGTQLPWWAALRPKRGSHFRYALRPDTTAVSAHISGTVICGILTVIFGIIILSSLAGFVFALLDERKNVMEKLMPLFIVIVFGPGIIWVWKGKKYLQSHCEEQYHLQYRKPPTTVETQHRILEIGREVDFWVEQKGSFENCHLQFYFVMIKTESFQVNGGRNSHTREERRECANWIVEIMEENRDITPDEPLRYEFSVLLDPDDYVPTVWYSYPHGSIHYDWILRVLLASADFEILIQREYPVILVDPEQQPA